MAEHFKGDHYVHAYGDDPRSLTQQRRGSLVKSNVVGKSVLELSKSVVKIYCYYSAQNFGMPWQKQRQSLAYSSGFIIEYNGKKIILCNAHGVSHYNSVQVRKAGGSKKFSARVLHIAHTCDLAILDVDDNMFWQDAQPLVLGELPDLQSDVLVIGYPTGGDTVSFTQGVVSRLCVNTYAHSGEVYLCVQIDAAINSGNSGGPVLLNDKTNPSSQHTVVGVAFESLNDSDGIGYVIPCCVIRHMLEAWTRRTSGTPSLNIVTQSLESQVMRDALHIPPLSAIVEHLYDCTAICDQVGEKRTCHPKLTQTLSGSPTHCRRASLSSSGSGGRPRSGSHKKSVAGEPVDDDGEQQQQQQQHHQHRDPEYDAETERLLLRRRHSADVTIGDEDEVYEYVRFLPIGENRVECPREFAIRKSDRCKHRPPASLIEYITSTHNDTAVGVKVCRVTPYTRVSEILQEGDVILTIDGTPIASDQTIILRAGERVRFTHLISSKQIGDRVEMIIVRDISIMRVMVPIEDKEYIAKWCQYSPPSYLVSLGLVMVPLSSNLMESEHGSRWMQVGEIPLLSLLFTGTLSRFHKDEEVVILTQILSHPCNEGYDYSMRRITHVNGMRVINLKHLAQLVHEIVTAYDEENRGKNIQGIIEVEDEQKDDEYIPAAEGPLKNNPEVDVISPENYTHGACADKAERYLTFKLENRHEIILDLKDSERNHLEILDRHQIPVPGASADIQPMYDIETVLMSPRGSITPRLSHRAGDVGSPSLSSPAPVLQQHKNFTFPGSSSRTNVMDIQTGFSPPSLGKIHAPKKPLFEDLKEEDVN